MLHRTAVASMASLLTTSRRRQIIGRREPAASYSTLAVLAGRSRRCSVTHPWSSRQTILPVVFMLAATSR